MLVLTRKLNEQIQIGDNITVSVLRIKGNSVRIGISAPRDVRVVRGELPPKPVTAAGEEDEEETFQRVAQTGERSLVISSRISSKPGENRLAMVGREVEEAAANWERSIEALRS